MHTQREDNHHKMNQNDDWNNKHDDDGVQKTDTNVDGPALLSFVGNKHVDLPLILHPTTSLPPSQSGNSSWFFSAVPHHDPALLRDSRSAILTDWPKLHVAHDGPVRSWERQEEYSGVEYNVCACRCSLSLSFHTSLSCCRFLTLSLRFLSLFCSFSLSLSLFL